LLVKKVKKEKTTFAKHHFFLFNDILLDTVKNREGKFKLAQVYSLSETSFMKYEGETGNVLRGVVHACTATHRITVLLQTRWPSSTRHRPNQQRRTWPRPST